MRLILLLLLSIGTTVHGGGPIMHLVIAELWRPNQSLSADLACGTLYPDMRYITGESRDQTHVKGVQLEDLPFAQSEFRQGELLHCYVDDERERYTLRSGFYDRLRPIAGSYPGTLAKLVEDAILFRQRKEGFAISVVAVPRPEAWRGDVTLTDLMRWHAYLAVYVAVGPEGLLKRLKSEGRGLFAVPPDMVARWADEIEGLVTDPTIVAHVDELIERFRLKFEAKAAAEVD